MACSGLSKSGKFSPKQQQRSSFGGGKQRGGGWPNETLEMAHKGLDVVKGHRGMELCCHVRLLVPGRNIQRHLKQR